MKTDTQIMNELAISSGCLTVITEGDAKTLKTLLLEMYQDVVSLCDKYNLLYMMGGGTCLGAIRHKGYIPWDDDIDVGMPRSDYDKFERLLKVANSLFMLLSTCCCKSLLKTFFIALSIGQEE